MMRVIRKFLGSAAPIVPENQQPTAEDKALMDKCKAVLERNYKDRLSLGRVFWMMLVRWNPDGIFTLPNGQQCHWASVPRVASTTVNEIFQTHLPEFWRGPTHIYAKPPWWRGVHSVFQELREVADKRIFAAPVSARVRERIQFTTPSLTIVNYREPTLKNYRYYNLRTGYPFRAAPDADVRFCVVRDPVSRFYSAYERLPWMRTEQGTWADEFRVPREHTTTPERWLNWLERRADERGAPTHLGKVQNPNAPESREFVEDLIQDHHFYPLPYFLGTEPSYYTHIFKINELPRLAEFLSDALGATITLQHKNKTTDTTKRSPALEPRIEKLYADDYHYWGKHF